MINFILKLFNSNVAPRVAVGSDIVWVPDIEASVRLFGDRYLRFIFTKQEIASCLQKEEEMSCLKLAARFAAKEATMKLLRPDRDILLPWRSIEVVQSPNGAANIELHDPASHLAEAAGIDHLSLSMSHDRDYATAVVVGVGMSNHRKELKSDWNG